jgi:hypothetical protein
LTGAVWHNSGATSVMGEVYVLLGPKGAGKTTTWGYSPVNDGMRAAFTNTSHMHLYVIYPALGAFSAVFMTLGLRNFRCKVLA